MFKYTLFFNCVVISVFNIVLSLSFMADDNVPDFEIGDVENFYSNKDEQFSHSMLVMMAMKKALEAGVREMRNGWFNIKTGNNGQVTKTYIDDTRKGFIESVKTCCMIMACDLDKEAEEYIDDCLQEVENKRIELAQIEEDSWNSQAESMKVLLKSKGIYNIAGHINHPDLKEQLVWFEIEMYRSIFAELSRLTKRLDFFKAESFEA
jgi:hypothetical protein